MITLQATITGRLFFPPKTLPSSVPGTTPLTIGQFFVINNEDKSIEIASVLGTPSDMAPGDYQIVVEPRAKKAKAGQSLWFVSAQKKGG